MSKLIQTISSGLKDIFEVFTLELHRIFTDGGVMLIFFVATLLYPLIFGWRWWTTPEARRAGGSSTSWMPPPK